MFLLISTHFTATPGIPLTSTSLKNSSFKCSLKVEPSGFTSDLPSRLRSLYTQSFRTTLAPYVLPRLLHVVSRSFLVRYSPFSSLTTGVYNPKTFFLHAASLHQGFPHCAISPTAASRRSLGRVSVPMWPFNLSVRLLIVDLVSRCLTNYLIRREAISERNTLIAKSCGFAMLCGITIRFQKLSHSQRQVPHVLLTRPPLRK